MLSCTSCRHWFESMCFERRQKLNVLNNHNEVEVILEAPVVYDADLDHCLANVFLENHGANCENSNGAASISLRKENSIYFIKVKVNNISK